MASLRQNLLNRFWYVQPVHVLIVKGSPSECLRTIQDAARPSLQRLHLRNLFMDGRRYFIDPMRDGFRLTSNSRIPWRRRARTSTAAVVYGKISAGGEGMTRIEMWARMRLFFLLDIFLIPTFMSSILVFAPWPPLLIGGLIGALFSLSWIWHHLTAALQAADILYFVEKALEDQSPQNIPILTEGAPDVITQNREFREQWQKFYEQHKNDPPIGES